MDLKMQERRRIKTNKEFEDILGSTKIVYQWKNQCIAIIIALVIVWFSFNSYGIYTKLQRPNCNL